MKSLASAACFAALTLLSGASACLAADFSSAPSPAGSPASAAPAGAATANTANAGLTGTDPERGWFFFQGPAPADSEPEALSLPPTPTQPPPEPKEERCKHKSTWKADCGFLDPGQDFDFQSKERDALLHQMVVSDNNPKAVEAFQYYMRWVLQRTAQITNLWWYNMTQNPDLDPTVNAPVSAFGLKLMTEVRKGSEAELFALIKKEGGFFILFSRDDCMYCHQMELPLKQLSKETGLPVRNASLDSKCLSSFTEGCMTAPATIPPAEALQVKTVPTVFLYVPDKTWLRIGTGIVDTESLKERAYQFFTAYRNALLKGVNNGIHGGPSVDFDSPTPNGNSTGVTPDESPKIPTESQLNAMLHGQPIPKNSK